VGFYLLVGLAIAYGFKPSFVRCDGVLNVGELAGAFIFFKRLMPNFWLEAANSAVMC